MILRANALPVIAIEQFDDVIEEATPLLRKHWAEIAHYPDIALDPDIEFYRACAAAGALRIFTARVDGLLVGYACFVVRPNPHYRGSLQAVQDILYVDPACRCSTIGLRLIRHCDEALRAEGVQAVYQHQKAKHPALGKIVERMGYEIVDIIWAKRLDREA